MRKFCQNLQNAQFFRPKTGSLPAFLPSAAGQNFDTFSILHTVERGESLQERGNFTPSVKTCRFCQLPRGGKLCGVTFCLPSACRDAPLGQRQGGVFRLPPPYLWTPPTPQCNNCDRRQRRKQGAVVGAAASKTRVPPKARSGCWVPQPVAKGCTPLTNLKQKSKHKKASAAPVGAIALTLFSLLHL